MPKISVIIPTKNRRRNLEETIRTLLAQTSMAGELIVVDQSHTESILPTSPLSLKYIYNPNTTGASQARTEGMRRATGDFWPFVDDVVLEPDFIEKLLAAYTPGVTGMSGIITNYSASPIMHQIWTAIFQLGPFHDKRQDIYYDAEKLAESSPIKVPGFTGALMCFRADVIRELRFDENLHGASFAEDIGFCARLLRNSVLLITPQARLVHNRSPEGRNSVNWVDLHAQGANYMRKRHWRSGIGNNLCFAWLNVGYALSATLSNIRRISLEPWRTWKRGAWRGKSLGRGVQST